MITILDIEKFLFDFKFKKNDFDLYESPGKVEIVFKRKRFLAALKSRKMKKVIENEKPMGIMISIIIRL